jgi:hypothetical protein
VVRPFLRSRRRWPICAHLRSSADDLPFPLDSRLSTLSPTGLPASGGACRSLASPLSAADCRPPPVVSSSARILSRAPFGRSSAPPPACPERRRGAGSPRYLRNLRITSGFLPRRPGPRGFVTAFTVRESHVRANALWIPRERNLIPPARPFTPLIVVHSSGCEGEHDLFGRNRKVYQLTPSEGVSSSAS